MATRKPQRQTRLLEASIPLLLRPAVRAYVLGYASSTAPRLLTLLVTHIGRRRRKDRDGHGDRDERERESLSTSAMKIVKGGLEWQRFATFCGLLVGGTTFLQIPLRRLIARLASGLSKAAQKRLSVWLSTFISGWLSIQLLQSKDSEAFMNRVPPNTYSSTGLAIKTTKFAGRTMDLTIFAMTRAVDVLIGDVWARRKARRVATNSWNSLDALISTLADPAIFASSCAFIMWAWVYADDLLPRGYNKWITRAAAVDARLVTALRRCRWGEIVYGQDTGEAPLLQSMCKDYNWPLQWGDPAVSVPFPCEIVHMGCGPSCEYHFLKRFATGFLTSLGMYAPLNLILLLRLGIPSRRAATAAAISSVRSSAFLGAFIAIFFYGVCLARSRFAPLYIAASNLTQQQIVRVRQQVDSGICIGYACSLCGWSILLENAGRRKDIALFVAPRALATLLPRKYEMRYQWRESLAFAASTAVVFTCVKENPGRVRGVLGKLLSGVLEA